MREGRNNLEYGKASLESRGLPANNRQGREDSSSSVVNPGEGGSGGDASPFAETSRLFSAIVLVVKEYYG